MTIPSDEQAHWDKAVQTAEEARPATRSPLPTLTEDERREGRLLRKQAQMVEDECKELLHWLTRWAANSVPNGATASERALWRTGILDGLHRIHVMANWKEPDDGRGKHQQRKQ